MSGRYPNSKGVTRPARPMCHCFISRAVAWHPTPISRRWWPPTSPKTPRSSSGARRAADRSRRRAPSKRRGTPAWSTCAAASTASTTPSAASPAPAGRNRTFPSRQRRRPKKPTRRWPPSAEASASLADRDAVLLAKRVDQTAVLVVQPRVSAPGRLGILQRARADGQDLIRVGQSRLRAQRPARQIHRRAALLPQPGLAGLLHQGVGVLRLGGRHRLGARRLRPRRFATPRRLGAFCRGRGARPGVLRAPGRGGPPPARTIGAPAGRAVAGPPPPPPRRRGAAPPSPRGRRGGRPQGG